MNNEAPLDQETRTRAKGPPLILVARFRKASVRWKPRAGARELQKWNPEAMAGCLEPRLTTMTAFSASTSAVESSCHAEQQRRMKPGLLIKKQPWRAASSLISGLNSALCRCSRYAGSMATQFSRVFRLPGRRKAQNSAKFAKFAKKGHHSWWCQKRFATAEVN